MGGKCKDPNYHRKYYVKHRERLKARAWIGINSNASLHREFLRGSEDGTRDGTLCTYEPGDRSSAQIQGQVCVECGKKKLSWSIIWTATAAPTNDSAWSQARTRTGWWACARPATSEEHQDELSEARHAT